jgi:hypothetical protein
MEKLSRLALSASAAVAIATAVGLAAAPPAGAAIAAKSLPCHASMSNSHPADYTTTDVRVKTAARAYVTTIAHYRTVNRKYHRRSNGAGSATVPYYISGATPGFRVVVSVYVSRGSRKGNCSTSFLPHR